LEPVFCVNWFSFLHTERPRFLCSPVGFLPLGSPSLYPNHPPRLCWEMTDLLKAWDRPAQLEASAKIKELFPNLADVPVVDLSRGGDGGVRDEDPLTEDPEAGELGKPTGFGEGDEEVRGVGRVTQWLTGRLRLLAKLSDTIYCTQHLHLDHCTRTCIAETDFRILFRVGQCVNYKSICAVKAVTCSRLLPGNAQ
jgi:hypothetical protein